MTTDLIALDLEVTQGVQDLNNSVRLVRDKRTFVRFHVRSNSGNHATFAQLLLFHDGQVRTLYPVNGFFGFINVRPAPDRAVLDHSFLFELPSGFRDGNVTMIAVLNPDTDWRDRFPLETSYINNLAATSVSFENVPSPQLVVYRVIYAEDGGVHIPPTAEVDQMIDWLRRAYPVRSVSAEYRAYFHGFARPSCGQVNSYLFSKKIWDIIFGTTPSFGARYYGMVSDTGSFMRGCAIDVPGLVSSGPTGSGTWGWDFDGSYGDWYGGHELAHNYARGHANFCGAGGGPSFPYSGGRISPVTSGDGAIYGFDIGNRAIYNPNWRDLMTYCNNQWLSDFTYERLMTYFQTNPILQDEAELAQDETLTDRLFVQGIIDPVTDEATLNPIFIIPNAPEVNARDEDGAYTIVLRDDTNTELARYPFTPAESHSGPQDPDLFPTEEELEFLIINELVPFVEGTARVEIEGPDNAVIASISAGLTPPTVTVTSPNGGETVTDALQVEWTASDADGDPLTFNVQYSTDAGQTWEMVTQNITGNSVEIDGLNLPASNEALVRVWASDGINTAFDASDAVFTVANNVPTAEISAPEPGTTIAYSQTMTFVVNAYDIETGTMEDDQISWESSLNGALGTGLNLVVSELVTGTHTITMTANDGAGGITTDTVDVEVLGLPTDAPTTTNRLSVGPRAIIFDTATQVISERIALDNLVSTDAINWTATASEPWVNLSATAGATPAEVLVSFDTSGLAPGRYTATVTVSTTGGTTESITIPVTAIVTQQDGSQANRLYLPVVIRR
ncbi:MAG: hypothetical protein HC876_05830 [Chloroflexaceae bacterium]|nr:hypothetical protein [Chloroflexaceae bacterium]NJO05070.1 hypothetical protein [Chloroflexaceae bacterium]